MATGSRLPAYDPDQLHDLVEHHAGVHLIILLHERAQLPQVRLDLPRVNLRRPNLLDAALGQLPGFAQIAGLS